MKKVTYILLVLYSLSNITLLAQPDECSTALLLQDVTDWCSSNSAYTNATATQSNVPLPNCFGAQSNDVWFRFVAVASDVNITIYGNNNNQGTLIQPVVALYSGDCTSLTFVRCAVSNSSNISELSVGGLLAGSTYFIRVSSRTNNNGSFRLCLNNYLPIPQPGQDCETGTFLCNKNPVSFSFQGGSGNNGNEAAGTCLENGGTASESNSVWIKWVCAQSGTLAFDITPTDPLGDIDFAIFELPNGVNNCSNKIFLRCNAAGDDLSSPELNCQGVTGLSCSDNDTSEDPGCGGGNNKYSRCIDMVAGRAYGLMINNYQNAGTGFHISFSGSGTFNGSIANFQTDKLVNCGATDITFTDQSVNTTQYEWNFGENAIPATANTVGPHTINYPVGVHTAILTTTSAGGCKDFKSVVIQIGELEINGNATETDCQTPTGTLAVNIVKGTPPFQISYDNGQTFTSSSNTIFNQNNLGAGLYNIIVRDATNCEERLTLNIRNRGGFGIDDIEVQGENCTAQNGSIAIRIVGGSPLYQYSIDNGVTFQSSNAQNFSFNSLQAGTYNIVVKDATNCLLRQRIVVNRIDNFLISNIIKTNANCTASDGSISLEISGGNAPLQYSLDNGASFITTNAVVQSYTNLPEGIYFAVVRDAYGCEESRIINLGNQSGFTILSYSVVNEYCRQNNAQIRINLAGGIGPYRYSLNNGNTWVVGNAIDTTFAGLSAGNYIVAVEDSRGCKAYEYIQVINNPGINLAGIGKTDATCALQNGVLIPFCSGGNPPYQFQWYDTIRMQIVGQDSVLRNIPSSVYILTISDNQGCEIQDTITVNDTPKPDLLAFPEDTTITEGDKIILYTNQANGTFQWYPASNLSCSDCPTPVASVLETTRFYVTYTNEYNCSDNDTVIIRVSKVPIVIKHPTAFTPNDDEMNNVVYPNTINVSKINIYRIYDRWGELMFENTDFEPNNPLYGWDGTYKGKPAPQATYVYYIEATTIKQTKQYIKGDFLLLR